MDRLVIAFTFFSGQEPSLAEALNSILHSKLNNIYIAKPNPSSHGLARLRNWITERAEKNSFLYIVSKVTDNVGLLKLVM